MIHKFQSELHHTVIFEPDWAWEFKAVKGTSWMPAMVPGCVHLDLLQNQQISDPFFRTNELEVQWIEMMDWEYRTNFPVEEEWLRFENLELDFSGLDTYAEIYLNKLLLLRTNNMFNGWRVSLREHLKLSELNELLIVFKSPVTHTLPLLETSKLQYPAVNDQAEKKVSIYSRKAPYHFGWDWGPRLVTSGIWRDLCIKGWNKARIVEIQIKQNELNRDFALLEAMVTIESQVTLETEIKLTIFDRKSSRIVLQTVRLLPGVRALKLPFSIARPKLWWPFGMGEQHLYSLEVQLIADSAADTLQTRFGLRTIQVITEADEPGETFFLKVNDVPVFMKGANYIPPDSFPPRVTQEHYRKLFQDMCAANFNMLRVWGGGYYEADYFYDLADECGILIWQDFMFACSLYPADDAFLQNIGLEAVYNIKRLRNHPSLALWCGNNEIAIAWKEWGWQENYGYSDADKKLLEQAYDSIFAETLPQAVAQFDSGRFYFPSSPISGWGNPKEFTRGDNHFWGVWHAGWPFEDYQTYIPRFMSEYGFQSFPDIITTQRFAVAEDFDLFSDVMLHHQRSGQGNALIKRYLEEWYQPPKDFPAFLYLSHLLQSEAIKMAIEAHRRAKPFCMGTLYWQLNDCWPGASWSSIDYYGRWKALHYVVAKSYAEIIVSPVLEGGRLGVYVISDKLTDLAAELRLSLLTFSGEVVWSFSKPILISANRSQLVWDEMLAFFGNLDEHRSCFAAQVCLNQEVLAENYMYFKKPRELALPRPNLKWQVSPDKNGTLITLGTDCLAKNVYLLLPEDMKSHFSDNYFDLMPDSKIQITAETKFTAGEIKAKLQISTLTDSFQA